jgi:hypothetical protein
MPTPADPNRVQAARPGWRRRLLLTLGVFAAGAFIWSQLPSGSYSTDLSGIGKGRPAVVLTQDPGYVGGAEVMELLNAIRADYEPRVAFKIAHLAYADAQDFARRHGADDGTVLLFAADGSQVGVLHQPRSTEVLRQALDKAVGR